MKKLRVQSIAGLDARMMRTDPWIVVILIIIPCLLLAFVLSAILYNHEKRKSFFA